MRGSPGEKEGGKNRKKVGMEGLELYAAFGALAEGRGLVSGCLNLKKGATC